MQKAAFGIHFVFQRDNLACPQERQLIININSTNTPSGAINALHGHAGLSPIYLFDSRLLSASNRPPDYMHAKKLP